MLQKVNFEPVLESARLLYEGSWVAERYTAIESFIHRQPQTLRPATRGIIAAGVARSAPQAFEAQFRLVASRRAVEPVQGPVEFLAP